MNNYKKLSMEEKNIIFENVWDNYSKTNKKSNIYTYLAIAAMIFLSLIIFSTSNNHNTKFKNNDDISSIITTDIYEDDEIIFDSSINDMSDKELENIIAQL